MPKPKNKQIVSAFFALSIAEILWGVNVPVIKVGLEHIQLPVFLSVTILGSGLLILPFARKHWKPLKQKDYLLLIIASIYVDFAGQCCAINGTAEDTEHQRFADNPAWAIFAFYIIGRILKRTPQHADFCGHNDRFCGRGGSYRQALGGRHGGVNQMIIGSLFVVLDVLCNVVSTLMLKPLLKRVHPYQLTSLHLIWGVIPIAIYSLPHLAALSPGSAGKAGYLAIFFNIVLITVANCLFYIGLKQKKAQAVGIYKYLHPVATAVAAWLILSEVPSHKVIVGAILIFVGIYYSEVRKRSKRLRFARA